MTDMEAVQGFARRFSTGMATAVSLFFAFLAVIVSRSVVLPLSGLTSVMERGRQLNALIAEFQE